jgi:hypothetical protein
VAQFGAGTPGSRRRTRRNQFVPRVALRDQAGDPAQRLPAVLHAYAFIQHQHHGHELAPLLHRGDHMPHARRRLRDFLAGLLTDAARDGQVRHDVPAGELADYCLHALTAAGALRTKAAVERLVTLTLTGLRPT